MRKECFRISSSYVSDETLDSLVPVDLAYRELIKPYDPMVLRLAEECKRSSQILEWVVGFSYARWLTLLGKYFGSSVEFGRCFKSSILMCAVLRALGFGEEHVFVIVTCHKGEPFSDALHAGTVVKIEDEWFYIDMTKSFCMGRVHGLVSLGNLVEHNRCIAMFNDAMSYIHL